MLLHNYPYREDRFYLVEGFWFGFRIPFLGGRQPNWVPNLLSVCGMEKIVQDKNDKEGKEGRILGPFSSSPEPNLRVSALGVMPKNALGKFCFIHHHSYAQGHHTT